MNFATAAVSEFLRELLTLLSTPYPHFRLYGHACLRTAVIQQGRNTATAAKRFCEQE